MSSGGGMMIRMFLALPLSGGQRDEVAAKIEPLRRGPEPVRWVAPENLHVTLRFFGDVGPDLRSRVEDRLASAARITAPFAWTLGGPGAFPNLGAPRVLWVGVSEGERDASSLAGNVEETLAGLGFPEEKRFHAHITVGRTKGRLSERFRERFGGLALDPVRREAPAFDLMRSVLTPKGAIYEKLRVFRLEREGEERR
ncbi:MAG: RNA 2',3'-cyclic phosphodiesterase [Candidatus Eisenbacteria bacterium]